MDIEQRKYLDLHFQALEDAWNELPDEERAEYMTFNQFFLEQYYKWLYEE